MSEGPQTRRFRSGRFAWVTFWLGVIATSTFILFATVPSDGLLVFAASGLAIGPFAIATPLAKRSLVALTIGVLVVAAYGLFVYLDIRARPRPISYPLDAAIPKNLGSN